MLVAIVAKARNGTIGKDNKLPWHLPEDLKFFKETTWNSVIIMGRKTLESLPKLLPHREHWVVTHHASYQPPFEGVRVFSSLEEILATIEAETGASGHPYGGDKAYFIIGGADVFRQSMHIVDIAYITRIDADIEGDAKLADLDQHLFERVAISEAKQAEAYSWTYHFETWKRKTSK